MSWDTVSEVSFLHALGTHREIHPPRQGFRWVAPREARRTLLEGYRAGALQRHRWGEIDREIVLQEVDRLLARTGP